jgi:NAD(P)-dependent dehydrogenase (short-subunit alcohol dehydrogenase family)
MLETQPQTSLLAPLRQQKSILVTGGTQGLGRELVSWFSDRNQNVATLGRNSENLADLRSIYPKIKAARVDLLNVGSAPTTVEPQSIIDFKRASFPHPSFSQFVDDLAKEFGKLDSVILNAGVTGLRPDSPIDPSEWIFSTIAQLYAVVPLLARSNGSLLFISSPLVHEASNMRRRLGAVPGEIEPYIRAKRAIEEHLIRECGVISRILGWDRIYFINPGSFDTAMHKDALQYGGDAVRARTQQRIAQGELRDPRALARVIGAMALTGCQFNLATKAYDRPIASCEKVVIVNEALQG